MLILSCLHIIILHPLVRTQSSFLFINIFYILLLLFLKSICYSIYSWSCSFTPSDILLKRRVWFSLKALWIILVFLRRPHIGHHRLHLSVWFLNDFRNVHNFVMIFINHCWSLAKPHLWKLQFFKCPHNFFHLQFSLFIIHFILFQHFFRFSIIF